MWEKFKNIHHMFHISLVFIIFPIAGVISGEYPLLTLLWTALFIVAYYTILTEKKPFYRLCPGGSCLPTFFILLFG